MANGFIVFALLCLSLFLTVSSDDDCISHLPEKKGDDLPALPVGQLKVGVSLSSVDEPDKADGKAIYERLVLSELLNVTKKGMNMSALIKHKYDSKGQDQTEQWIFNWTSDGFQMIMHGHNCSVGSKWSKEKFNKSRNPLQFPVDVCDPDHPAPRSLYDIVTMVNGIEHKNVTNVLSGDIFSGYLPYRRYFACKKFDKAKKWLEMTLGYINSTVVGDTSTVRSKVPIFVMVRVYSTKTGNESLVEGEESVDKGNGTDPTPVKPTNSRFYSFNEAIAAVPDAVVEKHYLPPPGTFCNGSISKGPPMPPFPHCFSASVEVFDDKDGTIDYVQLHYDGIEKLVGFRFDNKFKDDRLFTAGITKDKAGRFSVIHDYKTAIQYLRHLDELSECKPERLPTGVAPDGTGKQAESSRLLELKNPMELLFVPLQLASNKFQYVGKRLFMDVHTDVWITEGTSLFHKSNRTVTCEVYFTGADFSLMSGDGTVQKPQPIGVKVYIKNPGDGYSWTTSNVYHLHDMVVYDKNTDFAFAHMDDVTGCLSSTNDSFLAAEISHSPKLNDVENMKQFIFPALRKEIAKTANISVLRVVNMEIDQVPEGNAAIFFQILSPSGLSYDNRTLGQVNETTLESALKALNESLKKSDLSVTVQIGSKKQKFALAKNTLAAVTSFYTGERVEEHKGYSGGSMAALGIIMLLLGIAAGIGAGWYRWKRMPGGFSYHVYE